MEDLLVVQLFIFVILEGKNLFIKGYYYDN